MEKLLNLLGSEALLMCCLHFLLFLCPFLFPNHSPWSHHYYVVLKEFLLLVNILAWIWRSKCCISWGSLPGGFVLNSGF